MANLYPNRNRTQNGLSDRGHITGTNEINRTPVRTDASEVSRTPVRTTRQRDFDQGYAYGREDEQRVYEHDLYQRDNENAARGLLVGVLATSLLAIAVGSVFFLNRVATRRDINTPQSAPVVIPQGSSQTTTPTQPAQTQPVPTQQAPTQQVPAVNPNLPEAEGLSGAEAAPDAGAQIVTPAQPTAPTEPEAAPAPSNPTSTQPD